MYHHKQRAHSQYRNQVHVQRSCCPAALHLNVRKLLKCSFSKRHEGFYDHRSRNKLKMCFYMMVLSAHSVWGDIQKAKEIS